MAKKKPIQRAEPPKAAPQVPNKTARQPEAKTPMAMTDKWYIIILMAVVFAVNARTIGYEYTYDDAVFTSKGNLIDLPEMGGIHCIPALFTHGKNYCFDKSNNGSYRPLLPATFAVEHAILGDFNPTFSHFVNLVLACLLVMLLYKLLRRMFPAYSAYVPFLILLLFELHPIHTEVMASVKSRDEIIALIFSVLSMLQTFKYIEDNKAGHLVLSGVYFFIALLAKESPVCFIAIAPLSVYFFTSANIKKILISSIPYYAMIFLFLLIRHFILEAEAGDVSITENTFAGITDFSHKIGTILIIQLKYLELLILPHPLSFDYSYNQIPITSITNYVAIISLAIFTGLFVYAIATFKNKNVFAYCILFYFFAMGVTSGLLIRIGATAGERFIFIGSLAFCIAAVLLLAKLFKSDLATLTYEHSRTLSYTLIVISVLYAGKTIARNEDWSSNMALFRSGVVTAPNSWRSTNCLAVEYKRMATAETNPQVQLTECDSSIKYYKQSIAIYPLKADTHADLGAVYFMMKNFDSSIVYLNNALRLNPKLANAAGNMGTIYMNSSRFDMALKYYLMVVNNDKANIDATYILAQFNAGACYYNLQKKDSAIMLFKKSYQTSPDYNDHRAVGYVAQIYREQGNLDSATKYESLARQFKK